MNSKELLQRAALIAALFFGLGATSVKTETYSDIIEKAYNLSLQKERSQAILILVNSIKKESKKSAKAFKELTRALELVSSTFYSDKAQQLYELGISLKASDPALAGQKIADALKQEPDNILIQSTQLRLHIMQSDCSQALVAAKKLKEINPYSEEVDLVISQAAVCVGQFEVYLQYRPLAEDRHSPFWRQWRVVEIEYLFKKGLFAKGSEICQQVQKLDSKFPETYYWQWKIDLETKNSPELPADKYLGLCKSLSARAQREYLMEPSLCRRMTEVETFLKKNNNSNL